MIIWVQPIDLGFLNLRGKHTLAEFLQIEFIEFGDDFLVAKMPVNERTSQPLGLLHGGASCALAETVGSVAANFCIDQSKQLCLGLEINANHLRPVSKGFVYAKTHPIRIGRTTQVWHIDIHDEDTRHICVSRLTMSIQHKEMK